MEKTCNGIVHRVVAGDTLYRLSKQYGVRLIDILKENPYTNVYNLQIGEEICIPIHEDGDTERAYYSVKAGETLKSAAEELDTSVCEILKYNRELADMRIPLGTILRIPPEREK